MTFASSAAAQEKLTQHTLQLAPDVQAGKGAIADLAWLEGHWIGEGLGGTLEEIWTAPAGGKMMGMFRLVKDGEPVFYEIISLGVFDGEMAMRLKHVNPDMTGWEERNDFVTFRWIGVIDGVHHFSGLAIRRDGKDRMTMHLALKGKDVLREHVLTFKRVR
jgi:hypothetical protein